MLQAGEQYQSSHGVPVRDCGYRAIDSLSAEKVPGPGLGRLRNCAGPKVMIMISWGTGLPPCDMTASNRAQQGCNPTKMLLAACVAPRVSPRLVTGS